MGTFLPNSENHQKRHFLINPAARSVFSQGRCGYSPEDLTLMRGSEEGWCVIKRVTRLCADAVGVTKWG